MTLSIFSIDLTNYALDEDDRAPIGLKLCDLDEITTGRRKRGTTTYQEFGLELRSA